MCLLRRPLYQRSEGADDDRWRLVFCTETKRLIVEHEKTRGDMRGAGAATTIDDIEIAEFLTQRGEGQRELVRVPGMLFEEPTGVHRQDHRQHAAQDAL
jgi:hypothetical protein